MKLVYLMKRIKLDGEFDKKVKEIKKAKERIDLVENQYDYANNGTREYFNCELMLLNKKYNEMIKEAKNIYKGINQIKEV
jgi:hypothetical protein